MTILRAEGNDSRATALAWLEGVSEGEVGRCAAYWRGCTHIRADAWAQAILCFRESAADQFGARASHLALGACLLRAGVPEEAERLLLPLAEGTGTGQVLLQANYILGKLEQDRGEQAAARRYFARCYAINPGFMDVADRLAAPSPSVPEPVEDGPVEARSTDPPLEDDPQAGVSLDDLLAELGALVGLGAVKQRVRAVISRIRIDQRRRAAGLPVPETTGHMVFQGPPGTGKTTVARLVGRMYYLLGLLDSDTFVEASRTTLVGQHLGHTAARTKDVLETARGGVLFIDEAYQLQIEGIQGGDAFGTEAIGELVAYMENHRNEILVIAAGYSDEMDRFLAANDGLRSRFTTTLDFLSYTSGELLDILDCVLAGTGDKLTPSSRQVVSQLFVDVCARGLLDKLGNGRFVRNLYEKATEGRALRYEQEDVDTLTVTELSEILPDDVTFAATALLRGTQEGRESGEEPALGS